MADGTSLFRSNHRELKHHDFLTEKVHPGTTFDEYLGSVNSNA